MRTYEALYIIRPDLPDDEIQTIAKTTEQIVTSNGGTIVRSETWGKRKLAYEVKKFGEGFYVLLRFQAEAVVLTKLNTHFRLSESIIRHLVVYFDEKTLRLEEEQKKRVEADVRSGAAGRGRERDDEDAPAGGRRRRSRDDDDDEDDDY